MRPEIQINLKVAYQMLKFKAMIINKMFRYFVILGLMTFSNSSKAAEPVLDAPLLQQSQGYNLDGTIKRATPEEKNISPAW